MELLLFFLSFIVFFVGLTIFANKARRPDRIQFELKPNCLLTRWPVVFVTGRRSLFYFSRYWNLYPIYLAEHGYEVFTVHLSWQSSDERRKQFKDFMKAHKHKKYHFIMDSATVLELKDLLWAKPTAVSVTEIANEDFVSTLSNFQVRPLNMTGSSSSGLLLKFSFWLHGKLIQDSKNAATLDTLGALKGSALNNSQLLLSRVQELAEEDYQEEASP